MSKYSEKWVSASRNYLIKGLSGVGKTYFVENYVIPEILKDNTSKTSIDETVTDETSNDETGTSETITDDNRIDGTCSVNKYNFSERYIVTDSSTYEDLYGAFMPITDKEGKNTFKFVPGPAARIIKKALADTENKYVLFIDNLNKTDAYELLGNLFQLLDRDETGKSSYAVALTEDAKEWFNEELEDKKTDKLSLPENLYIICTMSAAKKTKYRLDVAFRRRFKMVYIDYDGKVYGNIPNNIKEDDKKIIKYDGESDSYNSDDWELIRTAINNKLIDDNAIPYVEDKLLSSHYLRLNSDEKYGQIDMVIAVWEHVVENVYRGKAPEWLSEVVTSSEDETSSEVETSSEGKRISFDTLIKAIENRDYFIQNLLEKAKKLQEQTDISEANTNNDNTNNDNTNNDNTTIDNIGETNNIEGN